MKYNIIFTDDSAAYVGKTTAGNVRDENNNRITDIIENPAVNFYIQNTSFIDTSTGQYEIMDVVVHDVNDNDTLDLFEDRFCVGATSMANNGTYRWRATAFIIDFQLI